MIKIEGSAEFKKIGGSIFLRMPSEMNSIGENVIKEYDCTVEIDGTQLKIMLTEKGKR